MRVAFCGERVDEIVTPRSVRVTSTDTEADVFNDVDRVSCNRLAELLAVCVLVDDSESEGSLFDAVNRLVTDGDFFTETVFVRELDRVTVNVRVTLHVRPS